jgi:hypothetical protein
LPSLGLAHSSGRNGTSSFSQLLSEDLCCQLQNFKVKHTSYVVSLTQPLILCVLHRLYVSVIKIFYKEEV